MAVYGEGMSDPKVPLTVLLGWSATAKARALQHIAGEASELAVLCNEPTEAPAVARVVETVERVAEKSLGCDCCALRLDVRTSVFRLLARRRPPKRIVVVAGADADPGPLLAAILCDLDMVRRTRLAAVVTVIEGHEAAVRLATGQPFTPGARSEEYVALADGVIVVGEAGLTASARSDVRRAVGTLNPFRPQWASGDGAWPEPDPEAGDAAYALAGVAARLDGIEDGHVLSPRSVLLDIGGEADPEALRDWVQGVCRDQGERVLRLQAVCSLRSGTDRWATSVVRSFFATGRCRSNPDRPPRARVLAVGRDLDVEALAGSLRLALASA